MKKIILLAFVILAFACKADAASLYLSQPSKSVNVGDNVSLKVMVNTEGVSINNVESQIIFPTDMLEVVSVSKSSSIFSIWIEDPKFSNSTGSINLNGGIPNPGYVGTSGEVVNIIFRTKKSGTATLNFSDSSVRANDGKGTNVLTSKGSAQINITPSTNVPSPYLSDIPQKPNATSSTHPNPSEWYANSTVSFEWNTPKGVDLVQAMVNQNPDFIPSVNYNPSANKKVLTNVKDGIYYFKLRYRNSSGWGPVFAQKIQIDTVSPENLVARIYKGENSYEIELSADDKLSGIDHFGIKIDNGDEIIVTSSDLHDGKFDLPVVTPGGHDVLVTAYDKAKNSVASKLTFKNEIKVQPVIYADKSEVVTGDDLRIWGNVGYKDAAVDVFVKNGDNQLSYHTVSDANGGFEINASDFGIGPSAEIWASVVITSPNEGLLSNKINIVVKDNSFLTTILDFVNRFAFEIKIALGFVAGVLVLYLLWFRFFGYRKFVSPNTKDVAKEMYEKLLSTKSDMESDIQILEKTLKGVELTRSEQIRFNKIKSKHARR